MGSAYPVSDSQQAGRQAEPNMERGSARICSHRLLPRRIVLAEALASLVMAQ